ncbi:twin-arginine translocation signal domain-containing protein [Faecalibacterium sp. AF27-11BH]|uniref:twin-arginine translocation signal domain-containing protein n=1 Tax=Faecalibacterium sp. AF27-11BH TaxID=2302956 RepID=UPI001FA964D4|nr:twin-arginine translocation signal domain-containing protein [Faecalibacterium sp. AF27-11BH]
MKITENKKGRCTGCCAAALFAGLDRTYDFLLVAPVFLHPAEKDAKNHLTNCYGGGVLYRKSRLHKKVMGACKKIVRLILMSNISRRKFLKGAGVAALAVAAAGVLAGCSDQSTPDISEKKKKVTLKYYSRSEGKIFGSVDIEVGVLVDSISYTTIQEKKPADTKDFYIVNTTDYKIPADGTVWINMNMNETAKPQIITIKYMAILGTSGPEEVAAATSSNWTKTVKVYGGGDVIDLDDVKLDGGYKIADVRDVVNGKIDEHNVATVYVTM